MLPFQQAIEVKHAVIEYLKATFRFKEKDVHQAFYRLVEDKDDGLFKGPYISLKTPFVSATPQEAEQIPLTIRPDGFLPHRHQLLSFQRLSTLDGHQPEPTLLTTGTGSGKTECFLYPVLDYCYQCHLQGQGKGVKVIIMYPMNALATDQAKRLAEIIYRDDRLRGTVNAGLFIGEGTSPVAHSKQMTEATIIEDRETIIETAPDIILTNFKMLDYALQNQHYRAIWQGNLDSGHPMLRFFVLDELHTYDGAQGTDVANLIRRLKLKLHIPQGRLCPVGTSATISGGEKSKQQLVEYATDVFGEQFSLESIIGEERQSVDSFFDSSLNTNMPSEADLRACNVHEAPMPDYILHTRQIWLPGYADDAESIGQGLRSLQIMHDLTRICSEHILTVDEIIMHLSVVNPAFARLNNKKLGIKVIETLLALVGEAKQQGGKQPLLFLQVQLWQRELSGIVRYIQQEPEFTWRDYLLQDGRIALPMYFCRDCGASGWLSTKNATDTRYNSDISKIMQAFMHSEKETVLLNLATSYHNPISEYQTDGVRQSQDFVSLHDLSILQSMRPDSIRLICISRSIQTNGESRFQKYCPECNSNSLAIVGGRTSTLSSVALSQLMASDFDESAPSERKVLTFTNSVQDAAHQAGFYEARTYRFLLRQSIQEFLKTQPHALSLTELQQGFKTYWKQQLDGDGYYYRFLPTDLLNTVDLDNNYRDENGQFTDAFRREFDLRVDYEICAEFSLMAQRGRTLEKVGSSATFFSPDALENVFGTMQQWLRENQLAYIADNRLGFMHFLNGVLHRMRLRGAVDHPYYCKYRTQELKWNNLNWSYDTTHFLNRQFWGGVQFPKFILTHYDRNLAQMLDITEVRRSQDNWYSQYFHRSLDNPNSPIRPYEEIVNDFYRQLFDCLTAEGIVNIAPAGGGNYAISPDMLFIEPHVKQIQCEQCQSIMSVAQSDMLTDGMCCLNYNCRGIYNTPQPDADNYYRMVYNRKGMPRIYAHEHTGLLERQKREQLETDFKLHPRFNSINALSATNTLEMGIDIGTLNVVGNSAIPPKPANFLQRIGRAGRRTGTALVLNYAHSDGAHDMFYFAEPQEMMEGDIQTPGCFLEAKDILRRHFFAFCIDSWVSADERNSVPKIIKLMGLNQQTLQSETFFLNQIFTFINSNKNEIKYRFLNQYPEKVQHSLRLLFDSLDDGSFFSVIRSVFEDLNSRLRQIYERLNTLKQRIDTLQNNDPLKQQLRQELRPLRRELDSLLNQSVIEYMTNAGLLPNYAFPETGVKLEAFVAHRRPTADSATIELEPDVFEVVRPASAALRDLAPTSRFYTQKYELRVSGVNTFDWRKTLMTYKFCSECDALAAENSEWFGKPVCPKCGSVSWNGQGNRHHYLNFTTARSSMLRKDAALSDKTDERERENFHIIKHFRFIPHGVTRSYALRNAGFGIEFCQDMELTEVNYGPKLANQSQIDIDNQKVPSSGYIVCSECGKAITTETAEAKDCHYPFCHHRDVAYPPDDAHKDLFVRTYLFKRTQTEALKILLPVHLLDTEASVQMFKAGIELGMRYFYQSGIDHLRVDTYQERNLATGKNDNYLVVYDTIPGGTGYLSRLQQPAEFSRLLQIAYDKIHSCTCQNEGKDGCYHCILTYQNQYIRKQLSRERTEELFRKLIGELGNWEQIDGSIGTVTQNGVIEDSELERRFVITMQRFCTKNSKWLWKKENTTSGYKYILTYRHGDKEIEYDVIPQYALGTAQGVAYTTIADFQIICRKALVNGRAIDLSSVPQWAVYLDGYNYHATAENGNIRFYSDLQKRESIRQNNLKQMRSWILTWDDLDIEEGTFGIISDDLPIRFVGNIHSEIAQCKNSFQRLMAILQLNELTAITKDSYLALLSTIEPDMLCSVGNINAIIENNTLDTLAQDITAEEMQAGQCYIKSKIILPNSLMKGSAWIMYNPIPPFTDKVKFAYHLVEGLSVIDKDDWQNFWRRYDLLQMF